MNCLTLDAGNSQLAVVFYQGEQKLETIRIATRPYPSPDQLIDLCTNLLSRYGIHSNATLLSISCVVPGLQATLMRFAQDLCASEVHWVDWTSAHHFQASLSARDEIGSDIIAGLVGARTYCQPPFVVIDCGTATTLTLVDENARILGVTILPGLVTQMQSLTHSAPHLPQEVSLVPPPHPYGNTTEESLQSGILYGHAGSIEGLVARYRALFPHQKVTALACGGLFHRISSLCSGIDVEQPELVNIGCRVLAATQGQEAL